MKIAVFDDQLKSCDCITTSVNRWMAEHKNDQIVNMFINTSASEGNHFQMITIVYRELVTPATDKAPAVYE